MTQCNKCDFYYQTSLEGGDCTIELPPFIVQVNARRSTTPENTCDFGRESKVKRETINEINTPNKKSKKKNNESKTITSFFRYFRPIDPKTGYADSSKGIGFFVVINYNNRTLRVSASVCNGDNFSKTIAKKISIDRMNSGNYWTFNLDSFAFSKTTLVEYIVWTLKSRFKRYDNHLVDRIVDMYDGKGC